LWRVALPGQLPVLTSLRAACAAQHYGQLSPRLRLNARGGLQAAALALPSGDGVPCSKAAALAALDAGALPSAVLRAVVDVRAPSLAPTVPDWPPAGVLAGTDALTTGA
jgi:hypothetical protein